MFDLSFEKLKQGLFYQDSHLTFFLTTGCPYGLGDSMLQCGMILSRQMSTKGFNMLSMPAIEQIPIREDENGRLRVGNSRVLLDLVIHSFQLGQTPETITEQYPTLSLDDVYLAIGYYLRHRPEVDEYLRAQKAEAEAFRREYEALHPPKITREVLLARLEAKRQSGSVE
jgi:uncharacterized protein (DUF433 family)